ncbi:hypothetical protein B0H11DRAFT_2320794 [Mycena galericulata]|nr:hypothetical protein B0H11DRAFT_2320794 [Mycena galericulata]
MSVYINGCLAPTVSYSYTLRSCLSHTFADTLPSARTEFSVSVFAGQHGYQSMTLALDIVGSLLLRFFWETTGQLKGLRLDHSFNSWAFISNPTHPLSSPLLPVAQQGPSSILQVVGTPSIASGFSGHPVAPATASPRSSIYPRQIQFRVQLSNHINSPFPVNITAA